MTDHATVNGVNATKRAAIIAKTAGLSDFIDGANEWGTKLRCIYDEYTVATGDTVAASARLTFGTLPVGARPLFAVFTQSGGGATAAGAVGSIQIAGVLATALLTTLTDMENATTQIVPFINTYVTSALTTASAVSVLLTATGDLDAATNITLAVFFILED